MQVTIVLNEDGVEDVFATPELAVEFVHRLIREDCGGLSPEDVERGENCIAGEEYEEWGYTIVTFDVVTKLDWAKEIR